MSRIEAPYAARYRRGFVIYQSCSLATLAGLLVAVVAVEGISWFFFLLLPIFAIASARVALAIYRAHNKLIELIVDEQGVNLRSFQPVPWAAIRTAETLSKMGKEYVKLSIDQHLVRYASTLHRLSAYFWNRPNTVTWIREDEYDCSWTTLLETMGRYYPALNRG